MRLTSFTAATVAVLAGSALLIAAPGASSADPSPSSAYGFSLGGSPGQPAAKFPEGPRNAGGELPAELGPLAAGGVLTVTADDDHATSEVTDLTLGGGLAQLPQELRTGLQQIQTACEELPAEPAEDLDKQILGKLPPKLQEVIDTPGNLRDLCSVIGEGTFTELASIDTLHVECTDKTGTVAVSDVRLFGSTTPVNDTGNVGKNTSILPAELDPLIKITLNRQTTKGKDFTVDGLVVELGGKEVAVLASTTCGEAPQAAEGSSPEAPTAPAPTPQQGNAPVTG
jgi:hypothetical protein